MPVQLLPASAAAFAPRASSVNVVLGSKIDTWLTQTLKRINRVKRPLNSVPQHQRCLTETLSSPNAIWTLCSILLGKAPESQLQCDNGPVSDALANYTMVHVEAYIVHVDMVLRNEVAFKLTPDTIETLVDYHKHVHCTDAKANTSQWPEKDSQIKKLHEDFVQAVNKYVFRTPVNALEGLEEEGAGELLCGRAEEVKTAITTMMKPLLPPPPPAPRIIDVVRRQPLLSTSSHHSHIPHWSQPTPPTTMPAIEPWRVLGSSSGVNQFDILPTTTSTSAPSSSIAVSSAAAMSMAAYTTADPSSSPLWTTANMCMSDMSRLGGHHHMHDSPPMPSSQIMPSYVPFTSPEMLYSPQPPVSAPMAMSPMESMMGGVQCGIGMGFGTFVGWDRYQELPTM